MRKIFWLIFLIGCTEKGPPLPQEKVQKILVELHVHRLYVERYYPLSSWDSLQRLALGAILQKENVSPQTWEETWNYYLRHPKKLQRLYDQMTQDLPRD
ncbi:MAG: DUF4296 domain-containing protein [Bacteroidia bacterium]